MPAVSPQKYKNPCKLKLPNALADRLFIMGTFRTGLARAVTVGILLMGAAVAPAAAATRTWVGVSGGLWSVAANWNENMFCL